MAEIVVLNLHTHLALFYRDISTPLYLEVYHVYRKKAEVLLKLLILMSKLLSLYENAMLLHIIQFFILTEKT